MNLQASIRSTIVHSGRMATKSSLGLLADAIWRWKLFILVFRPGWFLKAFRNSSSGTLKTKIVTGKQIIMTVINKFRANISSTCHFLKRKLKNMIFKANNYSYTIKESKTVSIRVRNRKSSMVHKIQNNRWLSINLPCAVQIW